MPRGSLWIADLGYFALKRLLILAKQGIYFLLRDIAGVLVWDEHGHLMDLLTDLPQEEGELLDQPVWLGASKQVAARLIAVKVPKEVIEQRREQRKRTGPQAEQTDQSAALGSGAVDGTGHQCADGHAECQRCLWAAESEMAN